MKKTLTLILALMLSLTLATGALAQAPDWLNLESNGVNAPMVNDGEKVTLDVVISQTATQGNAEDIWLWEYFRKYHNIDFNIEQVRDATEYKNLAFASGDLPDIVINMNLSAADLVTYGVDEHMLLPIDEYIDEYMPNLAALYAEHPEWRHSVTAPDGHIYGMGQISDPNDETRTGNYYIHAKWLNELGLEMPKTVDEFVEVMRAFKSNYEGAVPFNGAYNTNNPCMILLTAYGWITNDAKGLSPALRNGKVVFPYGDRGVYEEYLKTMNTLYAEELMSHDFYSLDNIAVNANVALGLAGTYTNAPWSASTEVYMDWDSPSPLTSNLNQTQLWPNNGNALTVNRWAISADTKYPELCCKLLDFFFNETGMTLAFYGPMSDSDVDTYGMTSGWRWDDATNWIVYDDILNDKENRYGGMENMYRQQKIMLFTGVQLGDIRHFFEAVADMAQTDYQSVWSLDSLDFRHYATAVEKIKPYYVDTYPNIVFFSQEVNNRIVDLRSVINSYVESETAKFVTGSRPISEEEMNKYYEELDKLGYQEYLQYYVDYYQENVLNAK